MSKQITPLTSEWTVRLAGVSHPAGAAYLRDVTVPAQVPGCCHQDLLAAGHIPDPYLDRNELEVAWIGQADWRYDTTVAAIPLGCERVDLVFEGLDTVATVTVDGAEVGETRNMHRSYRFDVTQRVAAGAQLSVLFTSAYTEAEAVKEQLGERPNAYPEPFNYIRKMACSFGWDWGPTLVTAGIWRPVRLEGWSTARLANVRPLVTVADGTGRVQVHLDLDRTAAGQERNLRALLEVDGKTVMVPMPAGTTSAIAELEVPEAAMWWPRGYGDQNLYECKVVLAEEDTGVELDRWQRRIGFRNLELDRGQDAHGTAFTFKVNGVATFARGVNWIPDDVLPARVGAERYRHRLTQAAEAGVNLVRVWGGGIYEDDAFYDICDELGLMVWQDFLFACAAYPEEEPLVSEVEAEARDNVIRLMPHPSLVVWNGNNENLWGFRDWEWEEPLAGRSWGEGYYLDLLPRIVAELDPTRPYSAGSPWSGSWEHHPNDPAHGPSHFWEVWNRRDYTDYLNDVPRFAAEFGWQAPPAYATLRAALPDEDLSPTSPGMLHHQRAEDGVGKLDRGLTHHFLPPEDFDSWHYLTQVNQARAIATAVAHWRSHWPVCAGTVVWQFNDCWPVTSWAAIDGAARPKPLYFELRRLYADRLVSIQTREGIRCLAVDNQSGQVWSGVASVRRMLVDGTALAEDVLPFEVEPYSVALLPLSGEVRSIQESEREFLVADAGELRDVALGCEDHEFAYPTPELLLDVEPAPGGVVATITASTFVRDLVLQADRLGAQAQADRGLITLLPGESCEVGIRGLDPAGLDLERLRAAIFCVNSAQARADKALQP
ncbi:glycosyl hydrolase 2 galactose-binding domain-containing protein [Kribbella catacumbae]|uniref:glycoside hydrolase family 2 protein n=1 Tax=Kribbella catacumbae TaxID=460086 RepID=UPI000368A9B9